MANLNERDSAAYAYFFMGSFGFIFFPLTIYAFIVAILPETDGLLWLGTLLMIAFFVSADLFFIAWLLPRRPVESFRVPEGAYEIPIRRLPMWWAFIVGSLVLLLAPILAPLLLILIASVAFTSPETVAPILEDWNLYNLYESISTIMDLPALIILLLLTPLFLPALYRMLKRQWATLKSNAVLRIDDNGITFGATEPIVIPWAAIASAETRDATSVLLKGDSRIEPLKPRIHRLWPKAFLPEGSEQAILRLDMFPVSASSVVALIRSKL